MAKRVSVDRWMFTVTTILVFVGLVMIFSASAVMAKERYGSAYEFLLKQLLWAVAGLAVMVVATKVDYKRLQHPALVFSFLGFTALLLVLPRFCSFLFSFLIALTALTAGFTSVRFRCSLRNWLSPHSFCFSPGFLKTRPTPWTTGATH